MNIKQQKSELSREEVMSEKKMNQASDAVMDDGRDSLKKAFIAFAIIEALVLIPVCLYMLFR